MACDPLLSSQWLAYPVEHLFAQNTNPCFDIVIVGSGYGAAIAAEYLSRTKNGAGNAPSICVLERGKEYLPGSFPSRMSSLAGHVRFSLPNSGDPEGTRSGLFDIRVGNGVNTLIANGLGGGSLINAGVMEKPHHSVFDERWPVALRGNSLDKDLADAQKLLGTSTISEHARVDGLLEKTRRLRELADSEDAFRETAITVAMADAPNQAQVELNACNLCGDCATGCNYNAKNSLDTNLLALAQQRGVAIYTQATVASFTREDDHVDLEVVHTDSVLASREDRPFNIRAGKLVLAAGTLGSSELMLKARRAGLEVSPALGSKFSGNGDSIAVQYDHTFPANAVAHEEQPAWQRRVGPTITGVLDMTSDSSGRPFVIEELAVPGPMRRIFEEMFTTARSLHSLAERDCSEHKAGFVQDDPFAVSSDKITHSSLFAVMGDDGAAGSLSLGPAAESPSDGQISMHWPSAPYNPLFTEQVTVLGELIQSSKTGGSLLPNPAWQFLPSDMESMLGVDKGPAVTVHPLGGNPMGDSGTSGVVDDCGRVYRPGDCDKEVYANLAILDGSIVPTALGTNPALTIAALAHRGVRALAQDWGYEERSQEPPLLQSRPRFSVPPQASKQQSTELEFTERLYGELDVEFDHKLVTCNAEVTLYFQTHDVLSLVRSSQERSSDSTYLPLIAGRPSLLRLLRKEDSAELISVPLNGGLRLFGRDSSKGLGRILRAGGAWALNRGLRDIVQHYQDKRAGLVSEAAPDIWSRISNALVLASRGGERRLFEYELSFAPGTAQGPLSSSWADGGKIFGTKLITYNRRANPLRQLTEMRLHQLPGLRCDGSAPVLKMLPEYLARKGLPLFRIVKQEDEIRALADLASLAMYLLRLLISIHIWSFRKPDQVTHPERKMLPGKLHHLPDPEKHKVRIRETANEYCLLTRYAQPQSGRQPVLMIHGYSASGTTFTHPTVQPNLASFLWTHGYDVWVLDLRSSCGMPFAGNNYRFEDLAFNDIPAALTHVFIYAGGRKVDVVAHCMGAAKLSMAILSAGDVADDHSYCEERRALPDRIGRLVLSQVGPVVKMAPENVFRAYLLSYMKHFLPLNDYRFMPGEDAGLASELIDRLLAALPYSDDEYDLENPLSPTKRTGFVQMRHRMDLLYGRTFSLANLSEQTLKHMGDLFGPLNIDTVMQVIHFAKLQTITDHAGNNDFVSREKLRRFWRFPTLSVHGADNGLVDPSTADRMQQVFEDAGVDYKHKLFDGLGHQDSLIGHSALPVFESIRDFLYEDDSIDVGPSTSKLMLQAPWSGPVMGDVYEKNGKRHWPLMLGSHPGLSLPQFALLMDKRNLEKADGALKCVRGNVHRLNLPEASGRWYSLDIDLDVFGETLPKEVLLLFAYDESPLLDSASFGQQAGHIDIEYESTADLYFNEALLSEGIVSLPKQTSDKALQFVFGSCQYPPGIVDEFPGYASYRRVAEALKHETSAPEFCLVCGDQVYVDSTAGLFDPSEMDERYLHPYRKLLRQHSVRDVYRQLPLYTILDDHEIIDNWQPGPNPPCSEDDYREALASYNKFLRPANIAPVSVGDKQTWWYEFRRNDFNFFVADSRTARQARNIGCDHRDLLGSAQWKQLEAWLEKVSNDDDPFRPKFVVSPAMLLPRHRDAVEMGYPHSSIRSDGWEGYPDSFAKLIALLKKYRPKNLIFLSGDAHLSCWAEACVLDGGGSKILKFWSVHSSALYAPFPFANSQADDFVECDRIDLEAPPDEGCSNTDTGKDLRVDAYLAPPGSGFTYVDAFEEEGSWRLSLRFDRENQSQQRVELELES